MCHRKNGVPTTGALGAFNLLTRQGVVPGPTMNSGRAEDMKTCAFSTATPYSRSENGMRTLRVQFAS
jgi:hypothetical protein